MGLSDGQKCCFLIFGAIYLASVIMIACSFSTLGPLEAGIETNTASKQIDATRVYTSGRYFLGLGKAFIKFPLTYIDVEFSSTSNADEPALSARSSAGPITIECSFQYSLDLKNLVTIYRNYDATYKDKFMKIAQNAIKNAASQFGPDQFYTNRRQVSQAMFDSVAAVLVTENAILQAFQLRKVTLPGPNEQKIIDKAVAAQQQNTALNEQRQKEVTAATTVITGQQNSLIAIFQANQTRLATVLVQNSLATAKGLTLQAESETYRVLRQDLGLNADELLRYLWYKQIRELPASAHLAVGFDQATVKIAAS